MRKSTLFVLLAVLFFAISAFFGYNYFTSAREESNVSMLLLFISNILLGIAMLSFSRNMARKE